MVCCVCGVVDVGDVDGVGDIGRVGDVDWVGDVGGIGGERLELGIACVKEDVGQRSTLPCAIALR